MKKVKDIQSALILFKEASINQAEATEQGDYKMGNKNYELILKVATYLKSKNSICELKPFLSDSSIGVRLWASCYLLPTFEKESLLVLREIAKTSGIHSLTAETTIVEWGKGNLKF